MIDLFNKKKIKEQEQKLKHTSFIISEKEKEINRQYNTIKNLQTAHNRVLDENKKLIDWVYKILNEFGELSTNKNISIRIPYYKDEELGCFGINDSRQFNEIRTTITIPELIINKTERIEQ